MDEFEIIRRYFSTGFAERGDVLLGVGDDGAMTQLPDGEQLVTVTDTLVADTHFPQGMDADAIAHRALAANLSDLAAMGARPRWFTLALTIPAPDSTWLAAFARGLRALSQSFELALIGGDTVRGPLAINITALGSVATASALRRDGARIGDGIFLTGATGAAGFAWQELAKGLTMSADDPLYQRFAYPEPRVEQGMALCGLATAAIDVSDGLHVDLSRLLEASGVGGDADVGALSIDPALRERAGDARARELALSGGDDYELCFTAPAALEAELHDRAKSWTCGCTRIGQVVAEQGLRWHRGGQAIDAPAAAFRHF